MRAQGEKARHAKGRSDTLRFGCHSSPPLPRRPRARWIAPEWARRAPPQRLRPRRRERRTLRSWLARAASRATTSTSSPARVRARVLPGSGRTRLRREVDRRAGLQGPDKPRNCIVADAYGFEVARQHCSSHVFREVREHDDARARWGRRTARWSAGGVSSGSVSLTGPRALSL